MFRDSGPVSHFQSVWLSLAVSVFEVHQGSACGKYIQVPQRNTTPLTLIIPVITQMIGLQTMAHTCALWGGHSGELGLHPYGSLLVKSQMLYDFPKQWLGTHKQNAKRLWLDTTWTWKQMWTIMKHSTFFLHLAKEQMSWEAIEMAKPEDTHQRLLIMNRERPEKEGSLNFTHVLQREKTMGRDRR